jgi:hypothetical protein
MNLNWGLFGANGIADISQTAATSTTSATNQNGFASGQYESFKIDSTSLELYALIEPIIAERTLP